MSWNARWSTAAAFVLVLQAVVVLPDGIITPVAAQTGPSPSFGAGGTATWNAYSWPASAGEPTLGVAWGQPGGVDATGAPNTGTTAMFQARLTQWRVDFDDSTMPPTATATDVSYGGMQSVIGFDPIMFTDVYTDRSWMGELEVAGTAAAGVAQPTVGCTELWYTDNNGGAWDPGYACMPYWFDHETVGAGPWPAGGPYVGPAGGVQAPAAVTGAIPPQSPVQFFPSAVYYCAQAAFTVLITECEVSYDGGMNYVPTAPPWNSPLGGGGGCGGLHGHIRVAPDGAAMLPNKNCSGAASYALTTDNGQTWAIRSPPGAGTGAFDPSVAPSYRSPAAHGLAPPTGDHYTYFGMAQTNGAYIGVTADDGATWNNNLGTGNGGPAGVRWLDVGQYANPPVLRAEFAEVIAGDYNRAAFAFLGSTSAAPTSGACNGPAIGHVWYQYVALTYDAGVTWDVQRVSDDPVQRGRIWNAGGNEGCRNLLDFQDIVVDAYGRVLIAQADGCTGPCVTAPAGTAYCQAGAPATSCNALATIVRQTTGRGLFAEFDTTGGPIVTTPGGPCPPQASPNLDIVSPTDGSLVTVAQPNFDGLVTRNNLGVTLTANANGPVTSPYMGLAFAPIPLVGTANCFAGPTYTCTWTPVGNTIPTFSPSANTCTPDVTFYTPGFFAVMLTVYDPVTGQTASDVAYVNVLPVGSYLPPLPPVYNPCLATGILFDNDPDVGDGPPVTDDHLNPGIAHGSGVNEFTCFGGNFNGQQFEFHLSVADIFLPTHTNNGAGPAPSYTGAAMEYYWIRFTPTFGPYASIPQTLQIMWDRISAPNPEACFLLAAVQVSNQASGSYLRTGQRPEQLCDPQRPATANIVGNTLVAGFSVLDLSPLGVIAGDEFQATFGWAWHFDESNAWDQPAPTLAINTATLGGGVITVTTCFTNGAGGSNCGLPEEDDFTPSCNVGSAAPAQGVNIQFTSPTTIGVAYSCNPAGPVTIIDPAYGRGLVQAEAEKVMAQGPSISTLLALGAPLPNPLGGLFGPSSIAPPTTPAALSSSTTTCPVAPPSPVYYEFVRLQPSWGPAVYVGVNTQNQNSDTWATLLDPLTLADNGWQSIDGTWCEGVNDGSGLQWVLLDTDSITINVDQPVSSSSQETEVEGEIVGETSTSNDMDHDGVEDGLDNCVANANPTQSDLDNDRSGDACDPDMDGDGVVQGSDNCPTVPNADRQDHDLDDVGDACDEDDDNDGILDIASGDTPADNCPFDANEGQHDADADGRGDMCDDDSDNDGVADFADFYPNDAARAINDANTDAEAAGQPIPLAANVGEAPAKPASDTQPWMYAAYAGLGALVAGILMAVIAAARRKD